MQSAQTPPGTACRVSGLAPSQPHPTPLLLSVQSHEVTIFPSALTGELCFKNRVMGKPLFISHQSSATLAVPKYQFNHCTSHVARIKAMKGCAVQRLTLKTQWAITQTLCYTMDNHKIHPWPSRNVTLHKTHGFEEPKAKLI